LRRRRRILVPVDDYECTGGSGVCERVSRDIFHGPNDVVLCRCGMVMRKIFTTMPAVAWAPGVHPKNEADRAVAQRNIESPVIQQGLKDGTMSPKRKSEIDDVPGPQGSSSVLTRIAAGFR
jgi:hypothetical protein